MRPEGGVVPGAHSSGVALGSSGGLMASGRCTQWGWRREIGSRSRVDTLAIKGQLLQSLGPQRGAEYLSLVARFPELPAVSGEAEERIPALLGPTGIHLHNQLVRGILSNAHCDHQPRRAPTACPRCTSSRRRPPRPPRRGATWRLQAQLQPSGAAWSLPAQQGLTAQGRMGGVRSIAGSRGGCWRGWKSGRRRRREEEEGEEEEEEEEEEEREEEGGVRDRRGAEGEGGARTRRRMTSG